MMPTKIFTLIMLLLILFGLTGVPTDIFTLLISSVIVSIAYLFAIKFNLVPSRIYLNHYSILYFIWLIKEIMLSSLGVMKIIWRKNLNLQPVFEWVDSEQQNDTSRVTDFLHKSKIVEGFLEETKPSTAAYTDVREERRRVSTTKSPTRLTYAGSLIYANSITLTPGTVTLDVSSNNMLLVHALEQSSIDNLKFGDSTMSKRVQQIWCHCEEA